MPLYNVQWGYTSPAWRGELGQLTGMTVTAARASWASRGYNPANLVVSDALRELVGLIDEDTAIVSGYQITSSLSGSGPCEAYVGALSVRLSVALDGADYLTWETGPETWAIPYNIPVVQSAVLTRDSAGTGHDGSGRGGNFGGQLIGQGSRRVVTPGTILNIGGYSRGSYESYPCTEHGVGNFSWGAIFWTSGEVEISRHVVGAHTLPAPGPGPTAWAGPDALAITVPANAAYMTLDKALMNRCEPSMWLDNVYVARVIPMSGPTPSSPAARAVTCAEWSDWQDLGILPSGITIVG